MPQVTSIYRLIQDIKIYELWCEIVQIIVAIIKNMIVVLKNMFEGLPTLIIPSLLGISIGLNADETIRITPEQSSWLCE